MARRGKIRPYTGRSNRTRNVLIGLLVLVFFYVFLAYTYHTDADFRAAVDSVMSVFQKEPSRPIDPSAQGADPTSTDAAGPIQAPNQEERHAAALAGNLLYRTAEQLTDPANAVELASAGHFDGLLVDLKVSGGSVVYRSQLDSAAVVQGLAPAAYDLQGLADLCLQRELYLVGRLSAFADHIAPGALPGSGVTVASGVAFLDGNYRRNLDPYKEPAMAYLAALTAEAASMGVREILLSDLTFPSYGKLSLIVYEGERDKREQLLLCIERLREMAAQNGAILTVELPLSAFLDPDYAQVSGQDFAFGGQLTTGAALHSGMEAERMTDEEQSLLQEFVARLPQDAPRSLTLTAATLASALPVFHQTGADRLLFVASGA